MTARHLQWILASVFIGLGGWCLVAPHSVEALGFREEYRVLNATSAVMMGCFGAQAVLAGILIASAEFRARTFLIFGVAGSLPFFLFNAYFYFVARMFTEWMLLDFMGNLTILGVGLWGWRLKRREARAQ